MVARLRSRFPIRAAFALITLSLFVCRTPSLGQVSVTANAGSTLAGSVPASARIFISVNRMADLDRAVSQAKAWRFLSFLGGHTAVVDPFDFKSVIQTFMGAGNPIPTDDLMQCEVGLAADSLSGLANPVWLVRSADDAMFRRWFPQHAQQGIDADSARVFRTEDGRFVCIRGNVAAVAPRASDWAQLGLVLRAMAGPDADVLEKLPAYRESIAYLPSRPLATIYIAGTEASESTIKVSANSLAVGMYSKGKTIDFAFRGARMQPLGQGSIAATAMERMLKLPQTTLGTYITTVDWTVLSEQRNEAMSGTLMRYARLLMELSRADIDSDSVTPRLGRHLIVAWGQDFSKNGSIPQFAALVETPDALLVTQSANRVAASLARIISTLELRDVSADLKVAQSTHLGVAISSIPLRKFAEASRFPWVKTLASLEPSWAASGDWFLVTLTPDHLNQILDAQIGFLGNLADQRNARTLREPPQQNISAAFLQGSLATLTLLRWEKSLRDVNAEGMFRKMWQPGVSDDENGTRLGIDISDKSEFGLVEVAGVSPSTPADGRLRPGDRIVGVDGRLLEMVSPGEDLRQWWEEAPPGSSHTLRVLRGELVLELEVTRRHDEVSMADLFAQPLDVLRELSRLCNDIPSATLQIHNTSDQHFSALLKLRLGPNE